MIGVFQRCELPEPQKIMSARRRNATAVEIDRSEQPEISANRFRLKSSLAAMWFRWLKMAQKTARAA